MLQTMRKSIAASLAFLLVWGMLGLGGANVVSADTGNDAADGSAERIKLQQLIKLVEGLDKRRFSGDKWDALMTEKGSARAVADNTAAGVQAWNDAAAALRAAQRTLARVEPAAMSQRIAVEKDSPLRFDSFNPSRNEAKILLGTWGEEVESSNRRFGIVTFNVGDSDISGAQVESITLRLHRTNNKIVDLPRAYFLDWDDWSHSGTNHLGTALKEEAFGNDKANIAAFLASAPSALGVYEALETYKNDGIFGKWDIDVKELVHQNANDKVTFLLAAANGGNNTDAEVASSKYAGVVSGEKKYGAELIVTYTEADKQELDTAIADAPTEGQEQYTPASWARVAAELAYAKLVQADQRATELEIADAIATLQTAIEGLKPAGDSDPDPGTEPGTDPEEGNGVVITEVISDSGLKHPGIGLTKEILENVQKQVNAKQEPWYSYYREMLRSSSASKTFNYSNRSTTDPTKPAITNFNSRDMNNKFGSDAQIAYTHAILYIITGDVEYRRNVMSILRLWAQMNPEGYAYFADARIHTGHATNRMATAAEIMRYSSTPEGYEELTWTETDTADLTNNLFRPIVETFQNDRNGFMNQNNFSIVGAMAALIFMDDYEGYAERVEWFTINKDAANQFFNGSIKQLYREIDTNAATGAALPEPIVQIIEMGRDQPHSADDIVTASVLSRMMIGQDTKVDPVHGTPSAAAEAVGPYEFLNDRILKAADYFAQYLLGYDTPWVPMEYSISHNPEAEPKAIYYKLSEMERGRLLSVFGWDLYYYYTYVKGVNVQASAPYFYEMFTKRLPMISYYWRGWEYNAWDSYYGAGDSFWLYIPAAASVEGDANVPKQQATGASDPARHRIQIEQRYTVYDEENAAKVSTGTESDVSFIRVNASETGTELALFHLAYPDRASENKIRRIGLYFRTNGPATLEISKEQDSEPYHKLYLPDTGGEWTYTTYDMGIDTVSFGQLPENYGLAYLTITGDAGTQVDLDHLNVNANAELTPPLFKSGNGDVNAVAYTGAPMTLDLSAVDAMASDTVVYSGNGLPSGASVNSATGQFTWTAGAAGNYSFIVEATDGKTITAKRVNIAVAATRNAALQAASAHIGDTVYTAATLHAYEEALANANAALSDSSDSVFYDRLAALKQAADGLRQVSPLLSDGSLDYTGLMQSSTVGNYISLLADGNDNTFPLEYLAQESGHLYDFGPDYKITADAFALEGRMNFVDRMAGSAVFGSNDNVNWTKLTAEETKFVRGLSRIEVLPELRDKRFRFIKVQKVTRHPDVLGGNTSGVFEPSEFRIYGERHETNNKVEYLSIDSAQKANGRVSTGNQVVLTLRATEPIHAVEVYIQGVAAQIATTDHKNITATAVMGANVASGPISFTVNYKRSDDSVADTLYFTTDNSRLSLVHPAKKLDINTVATVTASDKQWGDGILTKEQVGYLLFDGNVGTFGDLNTGLGAYYTIDFGEGSTVELDLVAAWPRAARVDRMNGLVVQASNDNKSWTTLSKGLSGVTQATWHQIVPNNRGEAVAYRYIRLYNAADWSGNLSEVELYGKLNPSQQALAQMASRIVSVPAPAENAGQLTLPAVSEGYSLSIKSAEPAGVIALDGTITKPERDTIVNLVLTLTRLETGASADTGPIRTSVIGSLAEKINIGEQATVTASHKEWSNPPGTKLDEVGIAARIYDGNGSTVGDLQEGSSYYTFDFGANRSVLLSRIRMLPRSSHASRMDGAFFQASNDGVNWTTITPTVSGSSGNVWTEIRMHNIAQTPYRYLRLANSGNWFGNIAEVELYGQVLKPTAGLTGPDKVAEGREWIVNYQLSGFTEPLVVHSATISYDPERFAFVKAVAPDGSQTVTASASGGQINLTMTALNEGGPMATMAAVHLRALPLPAEQATLESVVNLSAVSVETAGGAAQNVIIGERLKVNITKFDVASLQAVIAEARSALEAADVHESLPGSYKQEVYDELAAAVAAAEAALPEAASQPAIDDATAALTAALTQFRAAANVAVPVSGITLDRTELKLYVGSSAQLTATIAPADATDAGVAWSSGDAEVASVSATGAVTAHKAGTAVITAHTSDGGFTATVQVTVAAASSGESGQNGSGNSTVTEPEAVVQVGKNGLAFEVKANAEGLAKVAVKPEQLLRALAQVGSGALEIEINGDEETKKTQISIPVQAWLGNVAAAEARPVRIVAGGAAITLPATLAELATAETLTLHVSKVELESLTAELREQLGADAVAYELTLDVDGKSVTSFGAVGVKVELPYVLNAGDNPHQLVVYYLTENGAAVVVNNGKYNAATGRAEFVAKHFSRYAASLNPVAFSDLTGVPWAQAAIDSLAARGIVHGVGEERFAPSRSVTRAEFLAMLIGALELGDDGAEASFTDVDRKHWYYGAVASAQKLGIVKGKPDGSFGANATITRQDMAVMVYRALQAKGVVLQAEKAAEPFSDQTLIGGYASEAISALQRAGLMAGTGNGAFTPQAEATRAQAAAVIFRIL
jgi:hypothetical protein